MKKCHFCSRKTEDMEIDDKRRIPKKKCFSSDLNCFNPRIFDQITKKYFEISLVTPKNLRYFLNKLLASIFKRNQMDKVYQKHLDYEPKKVNIEKSTAIM